MSDICQNKICSQQMITFLTEVTCIQSDSHNTGWLLSSLYKSHKGWLLPSLYKSHNKGWLLPSLHKSHNKGWLLPSLHKSHNNGWLLPSLYKSKVIHINLEQETRGQADGELAYIQDARSGIQVFTSSFNSLEFKSSWGQYFQKSYFLKKHQWHGNQYYDTTLTHGQLIRF